MSVSRCLPGFVISSSGQEGGGEREGHPTYPYAIPMLLSLLYGLSIISAQR